MEAFLFEGQTEQLDRLLVQQRGKMSCVKPVMWIHEGRINSTMLDDSFVQNLILLGFWWWCLTTGDFIGLYHSEALSVHTCRYKYGHESHTTGPLRLLYT